MHARARATGKATPAAIYSYSRNALPVLVRDGSTADLLASIYAVWPALLHYVGGRGRIQHGWGLFSQARQNTAKAASAGSPVARNSSQELWGQLASAWHARRDPDPEL